MEDSNAEKDMKKTKKTETEEAAAHKPAAPAAPTRSIGSPRTFSFDQWASRRGIPSHHRGGMRAFVANSSKARTLEEWDACFVSY
jgi:hypothetical protein